MARNARAKSVDGASPTAPATGSGKSAGKSSKGHEGSIFGRGGRAARSARQLIRCYLCGARFEVSTRTMSTTCSGCHKAIKVEDVQIKSYLPVNDLQTCGQIRVTRRGRVAARNIQSGRGILCEGALEGSIESDGPVQLGPKSSWKGQVLVSRTLEVADGATLNGLVQVPGGKG